VLLEIVGNQAGPLVRPGRATVWRQRDRDRERTAIGHRRKLAAQHVGLRTGLPGVHDLIPARTRQTRDRAGLHLHAGGQDQAVIRQRPAARQPDSACRRVDRPDRVAHVLHPVTTHQRVVGQRDVGHLAIAGDNEIRQRAGHKRLVGFDQRDVDSTATPGAQVACGRGTAKAAADHHDLRCGCCARLTRRQHAERGGRDTGQGGL
jgi:hypothetical protein